MPDEEEANPAYRISARCVMVTALWRLSRGVEVAPLLAEAETIARARADPSTLSQVLQLCAGCAEGEIATSYADEALDLAAAAGSAWELAMAASERATCATTIAELREHLEWGDRAAG